MNQKRALVTGISGQDGSYLAELLLDKGYYVTGMVRRSSVSNLERINHILSNGNLSLVEGEVSDAFSVYSIIENGNFDEVYNLAAQSHVGTSFKQPAYTFDVNIKGPMNLLEAIRKYSPLTRFYQASTSELFGSNFDVDGHYNAYQDEDTPFKPQSPYACSKLAAHDMVRIYRDGYGLHASAGILFNHESERRGDQFVTRKITKWLSNFYHWRANVSSHALRFDTNTISTLPDANGDCFIFDKLRLGNLDAKRDWGHAQDYVRAMWLMLQQDVPDDYVISTGETHSVRDFLKEAFNAINITDYKGYIVIDPKYYRPSEVEYLRGLSIKARKKLGWEPKIQFKDLVNRMVWSDINGEKKNPKTLLSAKV